MENKTCLSKTLPSFMYIYCDQEARIRHALYSYKSRWCMLPADGQLLFKIFYFASVFTLDSNVNSLPRDVARYVATYLATSRGKDFFIYLTTWNK